MRRRNLFDRFLAFFAPRAAIQREKARFFLENLSERRFEAASKGRRTAGWSAPATDANAAFVNSLSLLRNRSRDMVRNDGFAAKAVQVIVDNVVGTGIVAKPNGKSSPKVKRANELWKSWAEALACDADGLHDFYGIQALAMRAIAESGEVLIRRVRTTSGPVPLQLQLIEADYLDSLKNEKLQGGGYITQGVEHDRTGRRVAYWVFAQHPGDLTQTNSVKSNRISADEILHLYRVDRPGQVRGVPFGASVMLTLRDYNEFMDAQMMRQKVAAAFSVFVRDVEAPADLVASDSPLIDKIEPGLIEYLPPGKDVTFASPPGVDGLGEFAAQTLRAVACGYGVPYESLTGDFSQVNFSSGRMGWLEFARNIDGLRWRLLVPRLCDQVWKWFAEAAALSGQNIDGVGVTWTPPRREMIDPTSEIGATITAIRGGMITLSEAIRQNGYDPETVMNERAADDAILEKLGIKLDSDPRVTMTSGMTQPDVTAQAAAEVANQNGS